MVQTNHITTLEKLLATSEIDVNKKAEQGDTALHLAARLGNQDMMAKLLEAKIDIESTNEQGETPLLSAAYATNTSAIEFLLENGANIKHPDNDGATALHIAVEQYSEETLDYIDTLSVVKKLLDHGANVTIETKQGETPLQVADRVNDVEVGEILIDAVLEKDPTTEKPGFNLSELNNYWDEKVREMEETPVAPPIVSRLKNVGFFPANQESSNGKENQAEKTPAVANLGK